MEERRCKRYFRNQLHWIECASALTRERLQMAMDKMILAMERNIAHRRDVYTGKYQNFSLTYERIDRHIIGSGGLLQTLIHVAERDRREDVRAYRFNLARQLLKQHTANRPLIFHSDKCAFLTASAISDVVFACRLAVQSTEEWDACRMMIDKMLSMNFAGQEEGAASSEVLYGMSGYLYSLARLTQCPIVSQQSRLLQRVEQEQRKAIKFIFDSADGDAPLTWRWHGQKYVGAAHGMAGILFILMKNRHLLSGEQLALIKRSIVRLISWRDSHDDGGGNFPTTVPSDSDDPRRHRSENDLVQFCHGVPGVLMCLSEAVITFPDLAEPILKECDSLAHYIWKYGLLRKGVGLCHGISGNAYALLMLWRATVHHCNVSNSNSNLSTVVAVNGREYLEQARGFCLFALDNYRLLAYVPDHPWSLYEGIGGLICLCSDLLDISNDNQRGENFLGMPGFANI